MQLVGVEKLEDTIASIIEDCIISGEIEKCYLAPDFCSSVDDRILWFSPFSMEFADKAMRKAVKEQFYYKIKQGDMFLFSLLHEIGHIVENTVQTPEEFKAKEKLHEKIEKSPYDLKLRKKYYTFPTERKANEWAVSMMKVTPQEMIDEINTRILLALEEFYGVNAVRLDD